MPVADGMILPRSPEAAIVSGAYNDSPLLTGITADEGSSIFTDYRLRDETAYRESVQRAYGAFSSRLLELYTMLLDDTPSAANVMSEPRMRVWREYFASGGNSALF